VFGSGPSTEKVHDPWDHVTALEPGTSRSLPSVAVPAPRGIDEVFINGPVSLERVFTAAVCELKRSVLKLPYTPGPEGVVEVGTALPSPPYCRVT
jgi:hypothetical protein